MRPFNFNLIAGASFRIQQPGKFLYLETCAGKVVVSDDVTGFTVALSQGDTHTRAVAFSSVLVENKTSGALDVVLYIGDDDLFRKAPPSSLTVSTPSGLDSLADVSLGAAATTLIKAINANRKEIIISNLSVNTQTFRIGDSGAAPANGVPLPPGASIVLTTLAAVYGYNPGAGAESVAVCELTA